MGGRGRAVPDWLPPLSIASWAMSSEAPRSATIRYAVRCAWSQWRSPRSLIPSVEPRCAQLIRARSSRPERRPESGELESGPVRAGAVTMAQS